MKLRFTNTFAVVLSVTALCLLSTACGIDLAMSAATAGTASGEAAKTNLRTYSEADAKLARVQVEQALRNYLMATGAIRALASPAA